MGNSKNVNPNDKAAQKLKREQEAERARKEKAKRLAKKEKLALKAEKQAQAERARRAKQKEKERLAREKEKAAKIKKSEREKAKSNPETVSSATKQRLATADKKALTKKEGQSTQNQNHVNKKTSEQKKDLNVNREKQQKLEKNEQPKPKSKPADAKTAVQEVPEIAPEKPAMLREMQIISNTPAKVTETNAEPETISNEPKRTIDIKRFFVKAVSSIKSLYTGKYRLYAAAVTFAVLVLVIVFSFLGIRNSSMRRSVDYTYFGNVETSLTREIEISSDEQLKRAKEVKRHGQTKAFDYFTNEAIRFNDWFADGIITFGNVSSNDCVLILTLLDDKNDVLYRSNGIEPGKYLPTIRLFKQVQNGEYDGRLYVSAYDAKTFELIGIQYTKVTLIIGDENNEQN